jgi:hypothetical protein
MHAGRDVFVMSALSLHFRSCHAEVCFCLFVSFIHLVVSRLTHAGCDELVMSALSLNVRSCHAELCFCLFGMICSPQ